MSKDTNRMSATLMVEMIVKAQLKVVGYYFKPTIKTFMCCYISQAIYPTRIELYFFYVIYMR